MPNSQLTYIIYIVPLREVPRGVAQGYIIIITTGRNDHLFVFTKKIAGKNNDFAFYPQYIFGVVNSSIFSTFGVLDIDVPTTDLLLRKYTQHTKLLHRMLCKTSRRASHFELQFRDRQEARRGTCGVGYGLLCRILCKEHVLRTREQEDNT